MNVCMCVRVFIQKWILLLYNECANIIGLWYNKFLSIYLSIYLSMFVYQRIYQVLLIATSNGIYFQKVLF